MKLEDTTAAHRRSFVPVADDSDFPIQNLPLGVFRSRDDGASGCATAIGDHVVDLSELERRELLPRLGAELLFQQPSLNAFAALGRGAWRQMRCALSYLLDQDTATLRDSAELRTAVLRPRSSVEMLLPMDIGDYTDFYSSKEHATNVGIMFRGKDNALQPNWLHVPVAYHGRASSIVISGADIRRPQGQTLPPGAERPVFGPSKAMDFELEMGFFIGPSNSLGQPTPIAQAEEHIFGLVLVNDWSARDIQRWEYVPLGPFLGKNFATSISPWVVTLEALEPFRCAGPQQDPEPLPYLRLAGRLSFDIQLEVALSAPDMAQPAVIARSNFKYLYWSMCQQLAHHTSNGCNLRTGDLLASGTISGSDPASYGSMLELAWKGERPLPLPGGLQRSMLADGDSVTMRGFAQGQGYRIGFGDVRGTIVS